LKNAETMAIGLKGKTQEKPLKSGVYLAGPTRLELATSGVTGQRSNRLNYDPALRVHQLYEFQRDCATPFAAAAICTIKGTNVSNGGEIKKHFAADPAGVELDLDFPRLIPGVIDPQGRSGQRPLLQHMDRATKGAGDRFIHRTCPIWFPPEF
jgi:hypothetical protein